jgi:hypothetical protein
VLYSVFGLQLLNNDGEQTRLLAPEPQFMTDEVAVQQVYLVYKLNIDGRYLNLSKPRLVTDIRQEAKAYATATINGKAATRGTLLKKIRV